MSDKKCERGKYLYLSAHLRAKEAKMLTAEKASRLLDSADFTEAAKQLCDCGYEDMSGMSMDEITAALNARKEAVFRDLVNMLPDKEIGDIFRIKYDYHNAKVLIKAEAMGTEREDLLSSVGRMKTEALKTAYFEESFAFCPDALAKSMMEAKRVLNRSENPQLAEFVLDKACYGELVSVAKKLGSRFISGYVDILIDCANLKTAVRCMRMGKSADFLRNALIDGGSVYTEKIAAANSPEALAAAFAVTKLRSAAAAGAEAVGGGRMTAFELACDNAVMAYLKDAKLVSYGEAPAVAYFAAFEAELTAVRMIMTGLKAGIAPDTIRERLRDFYA
ncbi:MAG: V-type ATPase subunit [Oscillospiraceae bacterium]|nr:V-type ATPase subunit [Oscillospiraceae bacterium]